METTCVFFKYNEEEVSSLLDAMEALHSLNFQLLDAKLLVFSEAKAAAAQEILHHSVSHYL